MSVKNNIVTLVLYIRRGYEIIAKTVHYVINVSSTETELFTIRCSISQVSKIQDVICIVVITDTIHVAKHIFDTSIHPH